MPDGLETAMMQSSSYTIPASDSVGRDSVFTSHPPVGINYGFPVVITGGPLKTTGDHLQFTSISVKVTDSRITVVSRDRFMREFDRFDILPDGSITGEKSSEEFCFYQSFCP